jgi:hypothetical protein
MASSICSNISCAIRAGGEEQAGRTVLDQLGDAADLAGDDRATRPHRLGDGEAKRLVPHRGDRHDVGARHQLRDIVAASEEARVDGELAREGFEFLALWTLTRHPERPARVARQRLDQDAEALLRDEVARRDEQQALLCDVECVAHRSPRIGRERLDLPHAVVHADDLLVRHVRAAEQSPPHEVGDRDDSVKGPRERAVNQVGRDLAGDPAARGRPGVVVDVDDSCTAGRQHRRDRAEQREEVQQGDPGAAVASDATQSGGEDEAAPGAKDLDTRARLLETSAHVEGDVGESERDGHAALSRTRDEVLEVDLGPAALVGAEVERDEQRAFAVSHGTPPS